MLPANYGNQSHYLVRAPSICFTHLSNMVTDSYAVRRLHVLSTRNFLTMLIRHSSSSALDFRRQITNNRSVQWHRILSCKLDRHIYHRQNRETQAYALWSDGSMPHNGPSGSTRKRRHVRNTDRVSSAFIRLQLVLRHRVVRNDLAIRTFGPFTCNR